jgi:hypothetical protein
MKVEIERSNPKPMSLKEYRKRKIKMLKRDFMIHLTDEEIAHFNELTSEIRIDQYAITMIMNHY